jgi:CheY-like chemotaxis protein
MSNREKVLVVDDDPDVLDQVTAVLSAEGYQVLTAGGEEEARETLLSVKPDLAILDLMMEHMDSGFVLANDLKRLYPETPVILLTAVTAATGMQFPAQSPEARSWLKTDYMMDKPVRPEQLKEEVRRLLRATPAARAASAAAEDPPHK